MKRTFRDKVKETAGRGRACLRIWSGLSIATVIKRTENKSIVEVMRKMTLGTLEHSAQLLRQAIEELEL